MKISNGVKVFLVDFSTLILRDVALELQKKDVEILYWTGNKAAFHSFSQDKENFPNTIFHDCFNAIRNIPAPGVDVSKFEPPSIELIKDLLECESIVLTMMARMDYKNMPIIQRKHIYYKFIQYWDGVLKTLKPDVIIFSVTPHAVYNFVLYAIAKKRNIPTIMGQLTFCPGKFIIARDCKEASKDLLKLYKEIKDEKHDIDELTPSTQDYFKKLINPTLDVTPEYKRKMDKKIKKPIKIIFNIRSVIKNIKSRTLLKTSYYYLKGLFGKRKILYNIDKDDDINYKSRIQLKKFKKIKDKYKKEYLKLQDEPDFNKKYIYFPLHVQPECTTSPLAGFYVDLNLIVKTLSASIPDDWLIYVKENSAQWNQYSYEAHFYRYKGYYAEMKKNKNARLLSPDISTYDLINNSQAVAVATGTAGWEAIARSKPTLLFGYPWYMYCNGVFCIDGPRACKDAVREIINGYKPNPQKVLNYLFALEKAWIKGAINIAEAFYKEIKKIEH